MSYDLDAAIREDRGESFTFSLGGKEFTLPHQKDIDKELLALTDSGGSGATLTMLKLALGDQWRAFNKIPLSIDGVDKLYEAWNKHSGVEAGE